MKAPTLRRPKGVPGDAVPVYPLAPASCEDPFTWLSLRLKRRGFELLPVAFEPFEPQPGCLYVMFQGWAIPPNGKGE